MGHMVGTRMWRVMLGLWLCMRRVVGVILRKAFGLLLGGRFRYSRMVVKVEVCLYLVFELWIHCRQGNCIDFFACIDKFQSCECQICHP